MNAPKPGAINHRLSQTPTFRPGLLAVCRSILEFQTTLYGRGELWEGVDGWGGVNEWGVRHDLLREISTCFALTEDLQGNNGDLYKLMWRFPNQHWPLDDTGHMDEVALHDSIMVQDMVRLRVINTLLNQTGN